MKAYNPSGSDWSSHWPRLLTSATSSQNGTVLFVFGDAQPIQRVEITFTGSTSGAFAGMTYANLRGP